MWVHAAFCHLPQPRFPGSAATAQPHHFGQFRLDNMPSSLNVLLEGTTRHISFLLCFKPDAGILSIGAGDATCSLTQRGVCSTMSRSFFHFIFLSCFCPDPFGLCLQGVWDASLPAQRLSVSSLFSHQSHAGPTLPVSSLPGDPSADEEGMHPRVLQRQKVHVCVLLPSQVPGCCRQQDVCQGQTSEDAPAALSFLLNPSPLPALALWPGRHTLTPVLVS